MARPKPSTLGENTLSITSAEQTTPAVSRRRFVQALAAVAATTSIAGAVPNAPAASATSTSAEAMRRRQSAYTLRQRAALQNKLAPGAKHVANGDEALYPNRIGNFSKGLPHDARGEVDPGAYAALLRAVESAEPAAFERIPMGCPDPAVRQKLVNPQAGWAFDMEGMDSQALTMPPAPAFASDQLAGEIVENYWMALARDIPFDEYETHPLTQLAAGDLSARRDFRGPKTAGTVQPGQLFRLGAPGDLVGPYVSQFLWLPAPFGAAYVEQQMRCSLSGQDFLTNYGEWLLVQNGYPPSHQLEYEPNRRYVRNGRDLGQWVHIDVLYQAYFHAMLILLASPDAYDFHSNGMGAPFDSSNPYWASTNQVGFGTFGGPHLASLMCEVASRALKTVWFQKWGVHRRLRPEAFAGCVHTHLAGVNSYPISSDLFASQALEAVHAKYGSYLLPMAFPEGSPLHPAYGAGHATVAGACTTILKAWFDESYEIPHPVVPTADGRSLQPYSGPPLTVGGELNKLAMNIAFGRNHAGVHWRSDAVESLKLGEAVAASVLRDHRNTYNEEFAGFSWTRFDGTQTTV